MCTAEISFGFLFAMETAQFSVASLFRFLSSCPSYRSVGWWILDHKEDAVPCVWLDLLFLCLWRERTTCIFSSQGQNALFLARISLDSLLTEKDLPANSPRQFKMRYPVSGFFVSASCGEILTHWLRTAKTQYLAAWVCYVSVPTLEDNDWTS